MANGNIVTDNFNSLFKNKMEFVNRLLKDKDLCRCLICPNKDFKKYQPTEEDIEKIPWNNIFPCLYTVGTIQEAKSFITMKFEYEKSKSAPIWKVGHVTLFIFCHKSIVNTQYGILRYDYMLQHVNDLLLNTRNETWIGKMEFAGMSDIIIDTDGNFIGIQVSYRNVELM